MNIFRHSDECVPGGMPWSMPCPYMPTDPAVKFHTANGAEPLAFTLPGDLEAKSTYMTHIIGVIL